MIEYQANLTCPYCRRVQRVTMPADACQYFYECAYCKQVIRPKEGDCCVFCSYADKLCPPRQRERLI